MAAKINLYNIGSLGVDLTRSVHHAEDGSWRRLQNAVPDHRGEFGGVSKRDGLTAVNGTGAGAALMGAIDVPFPAVTTRRFFVGFDSSQTDTFRSSTDEWATSAGVTSPSRVQEKAYVGNNMVPAYGSMMATVGNKVYYLKDGTKTLVSWNGTEERTLCVIPNDSTYAVKWIMSIIADGVYLYFITVDTEGYQDARQRVWQYNTQTNALLQIGPHFGDGGTGNNNSTAMCLTMFQGNLYVGIAEIRSNDTIPGRIYRIRPGVDAEWVLEHTTANDDWVISLCPYKGLLYAGVATKQTSRGKVLVRDAAGAWTTSVDTTNNGNGVRSAFGSLVVFGDNLYAVRREVSATQTTSDIYKFDGASWSSVHSIDITADAEPGPSFTHNGRVYILTISNTFVGKLHHSADGTTWTTVTSGLTADVIAAMAYLLT